MVTMRLVRWLALCQLAVSREVIPDPCGESCVSRPDAGDTALLQTAKASGDSGESISSKEFAEKMQCDAPENSFSLIGGGWTLVLSDFQNPGILWGDLAVIWEKGGPHKEYLGIDYTFMSQSYSFTDYLTVSSYLGVTLLPMTLWASQVIKLFLPLPFATGCNDFWKDKGFSGLYVTPPWNLAALKSPGFDDASWPRSMDPEDLIVDSLAFRIRVQPRLKVLPGTTGQHRTQVHNGLTRTLSTIPQGTPRRFLSHHSKTSGGGASVWPRRRRSYGLVVVVVVVGVGLGLGVRKTGRSSKKDCNRTSMVGGASGLSPGDCLFPCQVASHFLSNSSDSEGSPSISYQVDRLPGVDLAAPGELSELEWFAESPEWPENLTLPAGFLFDSPDLRNLLSTAERQRVQGFKETVDGGCPTSTQESYRTRAFPATTGQHLTLYLSTRWPFARRYVGLGGFMRLPRGARQCSSTEEVRGGNVDRWCLQ